MNDVFEELSRFIKGQQAVLVYFSTPQCSVCKALKPKVMDLLEQRFPKMGFKYIDCEANKQAAAAFSVFAVPTVLAFFDGRESFRFSRNLGLAQLEEALARPYDLMFR